MNKSIQIVLFGILVLGILSTCAIPTKSDASEEAGIEYTLHMYYCDDVLVGAAFEDKLFKNMLPAPANLVVLGADKVYEVAKSNFPPHKVKVGLPPEGCGKEAVTTDVTNGSKKKLPLN